MAGEQGAMDRNQSVHVGASDRVWRVVLIGQWQALEQKECLLMGTPAWSSGCGQVSSQPSCAAGLIIFPEEANEDRIPPGSLKMVTDKVSVKFIKKKKKKNTHTTG